MNASKPKYSLIIVLLIAFVFTFLKLSNPPKNPISYDNFGFYLYLPATFIYDDPGLEDLKVYEDIIEKYNSTPTFYQVTKASENRWAIRQFIGVSYFFAPWFFTAHIYASNSDLYPADGYSLPYQRAFWLGGFIYTLIGLFVLRKVLLKLFNDKLTSLILVLLFFGTNLFFFATVGNDAPHVYLFSIYPLILWFTIRWHESHKPLHAVLLGLFMGILIVARPSELFVLFIPLFWGVFDKQSFKDKMQLLWKYRMHMIYLVIAMFIAGFPQLLYWKYVSGQWIYFTYTDPESGLDLLSPHFYRALIGYRKGMLLYAPMFIFGFAGLIPLYKYNKKIFFSFALFIFFNVYFISSFSTLYSYGWRAFVQSYAIMVIPLGYFVYWIIQQKLWIRISFTIIVLFFIFLNVFQSYQVQYGIINGSRMSKDYYWKVFLKTKATEEDKKLLLIKRPETSKEKLENESDYNKRLLATFSFEEPEQYKEKYYDTTNVRSGKLALRMDSTYRFSPALRVRYKDLTDDYYAWIRITAWIYPSHKLPDDEALIVTAFNHKGELYKYRSLKITEPEVGAELNKWNKMTLDYLTPEVRSSRDHLEVYIWYRGKESIWVDDVVVEVFEKLPT